jgi:hypothetical protein
MEDQVPTLIFIDTNILLDFYRVRGREGDLSILDHIDENHDLIITTSQVEMEFKKNRPRKVPKLERPSCRPPIVVFEHATQPLPALDSTQGLLGWPLDQLIAKSLVVAFTMILLGNRRPILPNPRSFIRGTRASEKPSASIVRPSEESEQYSIACCQTLVTERWRFRSGCSTVRPAV